MNIKSKFKLWLLKKCFDKGFLFNMFFLYRHGYYPDICYPKTFNEKINYRKRYYINKLFVDCSDKIKVKDYVSSIITEKYIIPTLYTAVKISKNDIIKQFNNHGPIVIKTNHDSGGVFIIDNIDDDLKLTEIINEVNNRVKFNHGSVLSEHWYSDISPMILIEKKLDGEILDYKFHMFKKKNEKGFNTVLQVDIDRGHNHTRTLLDEEFNWLPFSWEKPCINNSLVKPKNYKLMLELAEKLAEPFSYVRVDMYNIDGKIYFGELTFSHGSGNEVFCTKGHDVWMGKLWELDPRN